VDATDEEIYGKYAAELLRFAATLVGPSMADDIMSNALLRAFSSRNWSTVSDHRPYLYRSVLNEANQVRRSDHRRSLREAAVASNGITHDDHLDLEVRDVLVRLTVRQRAVVYLTYWEDLAVAEVAETLCTSASTTERELRAARRRLKELLR
jgi:RNA polymerase sigma factor (sigma-70 family)